MSNQLLYGSEDIETWYNKVVSSCAHHDSDQAYSAWQKWDEMIGLVSPEQKSEVIYLQEQLSYTAFPSFPQDIAASLIEKHLISFLRSPVDIDEMIRNRFLYVGYGFEEGERKTLREAALKNTELVGEKAVSEWLGSLDGALAKAEDPESVMMQFFTQDQSVMALSRIDQAILRRLFQVYYDFLAFPVVTVYGLAESARKLAELEKSGVKEINLKEFFAPDKTAPREYIDDIPQSAALSRQGVVISSEKVSLPLLKALGKFEKLGGQQVTNSKIVVKGQNDPVRPTIFNWLRAYRDELGVGAHDSVTRGQFLFHSLNGKGLSSDERDQVGMLLKSIDENSPLTIDAGRQEVIFSESRIKNQESRMESKPLHREIPNTKYEIQNTASLPTQNISRAVFEMPHINQPSSAKASDGQSREPIQNTKYKIQDTNQGIPSAFEQAKAIQAAARENQVSMAKVASETVELGRVNAFPSVSPMAPRPRIEPAPQNMAPAPRAISFEPAKIDTFSFGSSLVREQKADAPLKPAERPLPMQNSGRTAPKAERPLFANGDNVGELSFSTKHVMPAEKEINSQQQTISKQELTDSSKQGMGNSGRTAKIAERPLQTQTADAPARGGQAAQAIVQPVPTQKAPVAPVVPTPPIQKPVASVNRFRITPTGRRDSAPSDATPSPHVVDLRS
ncbi:MAG: hypothetical protein KA034_00690 [Candidatus Moranbacteria bacterium]|nr:hypothetical protein [Candidatus Moranbacteria bacterium]